jgi:hypothetical protein
MSRIRRPHPDGSDRGAAYHSERMDLSPWVTTSLPHSISSPARLFDHADSIVNPSAYEMEIDLAARACDQFASLRFRVADIAAVAPHQNGAATARDLREALQIQDAPPLIATTSPGEGYQQLDHQIPCPVTLPPLRADQGNVSIKASAPRRREHSASTPSRRGHTMRKGGPPQGSALPKAVPEDVAGARLSQC